MIATSEDVAKRAGVSRATVSQILNGRGQRFADETRDRVLRAASELEYQPSAAARTLAMGASDIVIALVPNTTFGSNLQDLYEAATEELAAYGYTLVLRLSTPSTESLDRIVTTMKPRAVYSLTRFSSAERELLESRGALAIDPESSARDHDANADIGAAQARHLISRGYERLAFAHLHDTRQDPFGEGREAGVRKVCAEHGLPEPVSVRLDISIDDALAAIDSLPLPRVGVACYNDDVATALLSAATLRGWRVPEDVGVIGMDRTPLSAVTLPPLTTLGYDLAETGRNSIRRVLARLGHDVPAGTSSDVSIELVQGGTT